MNNARLIAAAVAGLVLLGGCGGPSGTEPSGTGSSGESWEGNGYVADARTDPELMQAVPDVVRPGDALEVVFPRGSTRGPGFVLERAAGEDWEWRFAISSDTDAPDMVNTFTAEEFVARNVEWTSGPAFASTDPHLIPVPNEAEPGVWRVCTVPDTPGLCAEFAITDDRA